MELWLDVQQGAYGLEAEPSYEPEDPKAVNFTLEHEIQLEVVNDSPTTQTTSGNLGMPTTSGAISVKHSNHPDLPRIRFLPDGSLSETSPKTLRLTGVDGRSIWLRLSRNGLNYEIRSQNN
jgi:hypothetical protein